MKSPSYAAEGRQAAFWPPTLETGDDSRDPIVRLNTLCLRYWPPIHGFFSDRGHVDREADRLCADFLAYLQREGFSRVGNHKRFRHFIEHELKSFLASRDDPNTTSPSPCTVDSQTRMDDSSAQHGASLDRRFAIEVIAHSMAELRNEAVSAGRLAIFERIQAYLAIPMTAEDVKRESVALDITPLFVIMAMRRLRQRFRLLIDAELSLLVTDPQTLAQERDAMFRALTSDP